MYIEKTYKIPQETEKQVDLLVYRVVNEFLAKTKLVVSEAQKEVFSDAVEEYKTLNKITVSDKPIIEIKEL